ncbi:HAD hydrolase family protein [Lactococcus lactis]
MIKAIAVDMDGTFLNSNNDYDRKAFLELFKKLKAKEVRFVVASGNQYAQISSFFQKFGKK